MKNISGIVSMNRMTNDFNNEVVIDNTAKSLVYESLEEIPHMILQEIQTIKCVGNSEQTSNLTCKSGDMDWKLTYINDISYQNRLINAVDFTETIYKKSKNTSTNEKTSKNFVFVTNIKFTKRNAFKIVAAGRSKWKMKDSITRRT